MKTASGVFLLGGDIHLRARARQRGVPITAGQYSEKGKGSTRRGTALQLCARLQLESNSHEPTVTLTAVLSEGYVSPKSPHALSAPTFSPGKGHSPEPLDRIYAGSARCDSPTSGREAPPSPRASRTRYGNRADAGLSLPHLRAPRTIRAPLPGELDPPGTRSLPSTPLRHRGAARRSDTRCGERPAPLRAAGGRTPSALPAALAVADGSALPFAVPPAARRVGVSRAAPTRIKHARAQGRSAGPAVRCPLRASQLLREAAGAAVTLRMRSVWCWSSMLALRKEVMITRP